MASVFRRFFKGTLILLNVILAIFFLLSCAAPNMNPQQWWFFYFLGLAFPVLFFLMLAFLIGWLIVRKKWALFSLIVLIIGYKSISVFFGIHDTKFVQAKEKGAIRIASWNVARFIELRENNNKGSRTRLRMMEQIEQQNADILCFQEFQSAGREGYYNNIRYVQTILKYPYFYFVYDQDGDQLYYSSIIFSRYPIIDSGVIRFPRPTLPDVLIHADIKVNDDTIRVYTTHLQSVQFRKSDYEKLEEVKSGEVSSSRPILSKLRNAVSNRKTQVDVIDKVLSDSPFPVVFCADLNDIPNSYSYFTIRKDMQDAFLEKGFGIGRTFNGISPTLRIDYIFAQDYFEVKQFKRIVKNYSDHYMLVADLKKKEVKKE